MYIGVDLGTSFSQVAIDNNNHVLRLVSAGVYGLPSSFYYDDIDGEVVGEEAENLAQGINASNIVREVKMKLGQRFILGGKEFTSDEIVKKIYRAILEQADDEGKKNIMDFNVDGIVITHPAKFNMKEINTLCEAAKNAIDIPTPIPVVGALKEPVAAAISYYRDARENFENGDGIIVFDLGGGTCDVALVQVNEDDAAEYTVVDSDMIRVGGRDWDKALYDYALEKINMGTNGAIVIAGNDAMENDLRKAVITTKHHLSKKEEASIRPNISALYSYPELSRGVPIKRNDFEALTSNLLNQAMDLLNTVYQRNRGNVKIKEIICVGGASNMPQISEAIKNSITDCVVRIYQPEYAVVNGAAIFAGKIMSKMIENGYGLDSLGDDPVIERTTEAVRDIIEDKLPFSYGIRCREFVGSNNFVVHNILKKGDVLPAAGSYDNFRLVGSGTSVKIEVYESESTDCNYPLDGSLKSEEVGQILLEIPNGIMEGVQVECALTMNSLDNIQLEAHDANGNHIKAEFKIAK